MILSPYSTNLRRRVAGSGAHSGERLAMAVAHLVVNVVLAVALCGSAAADFVRYERILVGLWLPPLGIAAAVGVVLFFVAALFVHLRARDYALGPVAAFGLLSVAALALGLA